MLYKKVFNTLKSIFKKAQGAVTQETAVVIGGAGFIGSHLSKKLLDENFNVHVVDNLSSGKKENVPNGAVFHLCDIRHINQLRKTFKKIKSVDYVFHLAAIPEIELTKKNPFKTNETNVVGTDYVLGVSNEAGVKRVIFSSSCAVYGEQEKIPINESAQTFSQSPYAFHKQIGELYCSLYSQSCSLATVSLRYFNVYGPNQPLKNAYSGAITIFLNQEKGNNPLTITGDGTQTRDFIHVSDVVRANIMAIRSNKVGAGEIINIGSGEGYDMNTIATIIGSKKKYIPARYEVRHSRADITKARELLGWEPLMAIEKGLAELKKSHGI